MKVRILSDKPRGIIVQREIEEAGHKIVSENPDIIVVAGYPKLLKKEEYNKVKYGAINLHAGPLPQYRGASPLNWLIAGAHIATRISIIQIDQGVDTGDILMQKSISLDGNIEDVHDRADQKFAEMTVKLLKQIEEGKTKPIKQDPNDGCFMTRRYPWDNLILWDQMTAKEVVNLVRASGKDYPAFCVLSEKIYIFEARMTKRTYFGVPGRIATHTQEGVVVICKDRGVLIVKASQVLPATGSTLLTVKEFIHACALPEAQPRRSFNRIPGVN